MYSSHREFILGVNAREERKDKGVGKQLGGVWRLDGSVRECVGWRGDEKRGRRGY